MTSQGMPLHSFSMPGQGPISLETENYWLRSLTVDDAGPTFLSWLKDKEIMDSLNLAPLDFTMERLRQFITGFTNRENYLIGLFARPHGKMVGFYTMDINLAHRTGQITTAIGDRAYWGRDALVETILALRDHLFAFRNIDKLSARILAKNRRVLFNFIGSQDFPFEAFLKKECLSQDGNRLDVMVFSAVKE